MAEEAHARSQQNWINSMSINRLHRFAIALALLGCVGGMCGGCFKDTTMSCPDGTTCSGGKVCAPLGGGCATLAQIAVCRGIPEGARCTARGVEEGSCLARVCSSTTWSAEVVVGRQQAATEVALLQPTAAAYGPDGLLYIATQNLVQRVDSAGVITTIAGTGDAGDTGDGGQATSAQLRGPGGLAVDGHGRVFVADTGNHRIRRIDAAGIITTVAGTGEGGYSNDNQVPTLAKLNSPQGVAVDGAGNLFIADTGNHRIRYVNSSATNSIIVTRAGTGTAGFNGDRTATDAELNNPTSVAVDNDGNVFIADSANHRVRKVGSNGAITTVAGIGSPGSTGDNSSAVMAALNNPTGVALDGDELLIADSGNHRVRRVVGGTISGAAGGGNGSAPESDEATAAILGERLGVAADPLGGFAVVDAFGMRVRHVDTTGTIATSAGNGTAAGSNGGGAATNTQLAGLNGLSSSPSGGFTFTNFPSLTYGVDDRTESISTIAGGGPIGYSGDNGPATAAGFLVPRGLAYDRDGNLYISDVVNHRVRRVDSKGIVITVAGNGGVWDGTGSGGDGGPAVMAPLGTSYDVAVDSTGNLYIADFANSRIRRVDRAGLITTIAGTTAGDSGDGFDAKRAQLRNPISIAIDSDDTLYISDTNNGKIRRVKDGKITLFAGGGTGPDGSAATSALLQRPFGIALGADHSLYIVEESTARVRRVRDGIITTVAGTGEFQFRADGGPAKDAPLSVPYDVAVDSKGGLLISEADHIRRVDPSGNITTVVGAIDPGAMGARTVARLADPRAVVSTPEMTLFAGGASGTLQALVDDRVRVVAGRYPQDRPTGTLARFRDRSFGAVGGAAYDPVTKRIFLTESTAHRIDVITTLDPADRLVDPANPSTWKIATLAGGAAGYHDGALASARFRNPTGLYFDPEQRQLYVADTDNHVVRVIDLAGGLPGATVGTIAGKAGASGWAGDNREAISALLYSPSAVTRCPNGDVFVSDTGNHRVRRISRDTVDSPGTITTVLGDGTASSSGEGEPSATLPIASPRGLACDAAGNLFVTSTTAVRMVIADDERVVDGTGAVRTIYGAPTAQDEFPMSATRCLSGLDMTGAGKLRVTDACAGIMIEVQRKARP
jgi:sugar lactone lactonase YvrE